MRVVVSVSDKYLWSLRPFAYLFNKYWSPDQEVIVAGYSEPNFKLPDNFEFYSIAVPQYPKEKWVDGFLKFMRAINDDRFVLMLEDYWLCRSVDTKGISVLGNMIEVDPDHLLRIDLTADRQYAGNMKDIGYFDRFDIIEAKESQYQMSLQVGIWNRKLLYNLLEFLPGDKRSAWDVELEGTTLVEYLRYNVVGTRQNLVRYVNGMNNAKSNEINYTGFTPEDKEVVQQMVEELRNE